MSAVTRFGPLNNPMGHVVQRVYHLTSYRMRSCSVELTTDNLITDM